MLKKIREIFKKRESIDGLSKAMSIVDKHLVTGSGVEALSYSAGYAQGKIRALYEHGEITKNEMETAITTLDNHYGKLRLQEAKMEYLEYFQT